MDISTNNSTKKSPRVDLTPMVDLGFLLITFFIFSTTMSEKRVMKLNSPKEEATVPPSQAGEKKTLNLLLGDKDRVFYYNGNDSLNLRATDYSAHGLRRIINEKKELVRTDFGTDSVAIFLIKPTKLSSYKNLVDVLDEMLIADIKTYVLMDPRQYEERSALTMAH